MNETKIWKLLGLVFVAIFALSGVNIAHADSVLTTVTVHTYPQGAAYDPATHEVYVCDPTSDDVAVISDTSHALTTTLSLVFAGAPEQLAYDSSLGEMFVATNAGVSVISDSTKAVTSPVNVTDGFSDIAYDSAKGELFVSYPYATMVSVISDTTYAMVANITMPEYAGSLAYDSSKGEVFVSEGNPYTGNMQVISDKNNEIVASIPVGGHGPGSVVYDSAKGEIFTTNYTSYNPSPSVSVISDSSNKVVKSFTITATGILAYDGNGKIYINESNNTEVISDKTNSVTATVNTGIDAPTGIAYDSGTSEVYAVSSDVPGVVTVISDSSGGSTPTTNPTSSATGPTATTTATSTPKVPEFSNAALISLVAAMIALTIPVVALKTRRTSRR